MSNSAHPALLPAPKRVRWGAGLLRLPRPLVIHVHRGDDGARAAAGLLVDEVARRHGGRLGVAIGHVIADGTPAVTLFTGRGPHAGKERAAEGYALAAGRGGVFITGADAAGLKNGVWTLLQLLHRSGAGFTVPHVEIEDWPSLKVRGVLLDVSRWKVPTLSALKDLANRLAAWKVNHLQLYVENVFRFRRYPGIGRGYGRLTGTEIAALDAHCRKLGIELVPNLASFGHLEKMLERPELRKHSVGPNWSLLNPLVPSTYRFLGRLYDEYLPNFSSRWFNINCDETWGLGKGRSARLVKRLGAGEVYVRHVLRVIDMIRRRHGRRVLMWGDILSHHPETIRRLPRDLIVLPWGYFNRWTPRQVRPFTRAKLDFIICGGTSAWHSPSPWTHVANRNMKSAAATARRCGGLGVITTDWGDGGHQQPAGLSRYGLAFGGEQAWTGGATPEPDFDRRFSALEFTDSRGDAARLWRAFGAANDALGLKPVYVMWWFTVNFGLLFYDHLEREAPTAPLRQGEGPLFKRVTLAGVRRLAAVTQRARRALQALDRRQGGDPLIRRELNYAVRELEHLVAQLRWRLDLKHRRRGAAMARRGRALRQDLAWIHREFLVLWRARNRPQGKRIHLALLRKTDAFYRRLIVSAR